MIIRKAKIEDSVEIAENLFLAMEDILYEFIGMKDTEEAKKFLLYFVENKNNQYSYENCFVAENEKGIEGSINIYNGAELNRLRMPIIQHIKEHYNKDFCPEKETQQGEFYIDSFGVNPKSQGKGIGSKLLQFIINNPDFNQQTLGLLVDEENPNAEKLSLNFGFKSIGQKKLAGKKLKHLQREPTK